MEQQPRGGDQEKISKAESGGVERVQRFQFGPWLFNVNGGRAIIAEAPREPVQLPVAPWAQFFGLDRPADATSISLFSPLPSFDRDYAMATDLSEPLMVATLQNSDGESFPLLIDGIHRLYRAHVEQAGRLPAYVLSVAESLAIREDGFIGSAVHWPSFDNERRMTGGMEAGGAVG